MKLRHSPTSPFVRKVMVAAYELDLESRIERIPTRVAPTQRNDEVVRENPLVKIPALTTDDGLVIYDIQDESARTSEPRSRNIT